MDLPLRSLDPEELQAYDRDGVICAKGLFPDAWLERMAGAVDRIVSEPTFFGDAVSKRDEGFSGDLFLWKLDDDFRDWVYGSPAAQIAQQILRSPQVWHFYDQLFVKSAGCPVPTPWHHDVTFWPVDVECRNLVSIWITFDPVSRASSGLDFIPGSHRWPGRFKAVTPTYDPYMLNSDFEDLPEITDDHPDYDLFCPDMEAGDCLIFNAHVVHGSSSNFSIDSDRRAFSTRWAGEGVAFEKRGATMPLLWEHGLSDGDPLGGSLFPRILPSPVYGECARWTGPPEPPEPGHLKQVMAEIQESLRAAAR